MKKTVSLMLILLLAACGGGLENKLSSNIWNVVATNGEAYTAEFAEDTATFKMNEFMTVGMQYEINDDKITLIENDQYKHIFNIEKEKDEYIFKAATDEVKERFGDLTLSPKKEK